MTLLNAIYYSVAMSKQKRTGPGRPCLSKAKKKSVQIVFRVKPALHRKILKAAKNQGKPMAKWVRDTLEEILEDK